MTETDYSKLKSEATSRAKELLADILPDNQVADLLGDVYEIEDKYLMGKGHKQETRIAKAGISEKRTKANYRAWETRRGEKPPKAEEVKQDTSNLKELAVKWREEQKALKLQREQQVEFQPELALAPPKKYMSIWTPHPGKQTQFLESTEYEVLFCGGRGSGKSDCLLADALRFVGNGNFRGLIIRRTIPALRDLIKRACMLYPKVVKGAKFIDKEKIFVFPSGAIIEFGYYDHPDDYDRYHGREFCWLGIDEISLYEDREYYDKLKSVVRTTDPTLPKRIRVATNPSGPGRVWIKEYFLDAGDENTTIVTKVKLKNGVEVTLTKKWIKATIFDNPTMVQNDPEYIADLMALPEIKRRQWVDGDFEAAEGLAFSDFHPDYHVIEPSEISSNWIKFRGCDWGFRAKAVCLWIAVDFDGNYYVYREFVTQQMTADIFAQNVLALDGDEYISYGVIDGSVGDERGISGPTIDEQMRNEGLIWRYADKKPGSRIHRKMTLHQLLKLDPVTKKPRIFIFNTCKQLIKELGSLPVDPNNSEDVDTTMEDHAYDAVTYALASRPDKNYINNRQLHYHQRPDVMVDSKYGY